MVAGGRPRKRDILPEPPPEVAALIDDAWYLQTYPDVAASGVSPAHHYLANGAAELRDPNPLFSTRWYLTRNPDVAMSGENPLVHYVREGAAQGRDPHPLFDTDWYAATNPELLTERMNPLQHYLTVDVARDADPHPYIDSAWYRERYLPSGSADIPVVHFSDVGWRHGCDPNPDFDVDWYQTVNQDIADLAVNPLLHFMERGAREGRAPNPLFDPAWYREAYPESGEDAFRHYRTAGKAEGRATCRLLSWAGTRGIPDQTSEQSSVTILIPTFGKWHLTERCLDALSRTEAAQIAEVIVVDDAGPGDQPWDRLSRFPWARVLHLDSNRGYLEACRMGAVGVKTDFLLLLNNDTEPLPGFLLWMLERFRISPDVGAVGARLVRPDGTNQEAGAIVWESAPPFQYGRDLDVSDSRYGYARIVDYSSAAALLIRTGEWHALGGFDPALAPAYYEDVDFCLRLRQRGLPTWYEPEALVVHYEGGTYGSVSGGDLGASPPGLNRGRFEGKWRGVLRELPSQGDVPLEVAANPAGRRVVFLVRQTPLTPDRDAGSLRAMEMIRCWQELGFRVVLFTPGRAADESWARKLQTAGVEVLVDPERVADFLRRNRDWVASLWFSHLPAVWDWLPALQDAVPEIPTVWDTVDLQHVREGRQAEVSGSVFGRARAEVNRGREAWAAAAVDLCVAVSDEEGAVLGRLAPDAIVRRVGTIHDVALNSPGWAARRGLLFVGSFHHAPNLDALNWFIDEVWPILPAAVRDGGLDVVGTPVPNAMALSEAHDIRLLGSVPDLGPALAAARLSLAPLRFGAGVKGKVSEAWAAGLPVVATPLALEGMGADRYPAAEEARDFADLLVRFYTDEDTWREAQHIGIAAVQERFSRAAARLMLAQIQSKLDEQRGRYRGDRPRADAGDGIIPPWDLPEALSGMRSHPR